MAERLNLVTGALGFTGSYLLRELLDRGHNVVGTDLPAAVEEASDNDVLASIGLDVDHPNLELVPSNLLDPDTLTSLFERPITHIYHPASLYDYSAPMETLRKVNVEGTRNLLNAFSNEDIERFVHWSTCGVFGKPRTAADSKDTNLPFTESENPSPKNTPLDYDSPPDTKLVNDYSVTKWEQEQMMWKEHRENDLPLTVIRPAPIYGPGSSYGHGGIVLAVSYGLVPAIPADSKNYITTSVHVEDVARFAIFISDREEGLGEDYNLADNSIISYHEFMHFIALLCGRNMYDIPFVKNTMIKPIFTRAARIWNWLEDNYNIPRVRVFEIQSAVYMSSSYWISNRKALKTGFDYNYLDVKDGLKDLTAWFRKMGWMNNAEQVFVVSPDGSKRS
ncbi:MAG: NAD-dependent epimerase/dehydratase family protein [bacterium]